MENLRTLICKIMLGGSFAASSLLLSSKAVAYDQIFTHPALTRESVNVYNASFPRNKLSEADKSWLIQGSSDEDIPPRWLNHFYDPVYQKGWMGYTTSKDWAYSSKKQQILAVSAESLQAGIVNGIKNAKSAFADYSYQRALHDYAVGDRQRAMISMGHVMHLLEDANVPDHTRGDTHLPAKGEESPYEKATARSSFWDHIFSQGQKPIELGNLNAYFAELADYSNHYFYSKDTILTQKYRSPIKLWEEKIKDGSRFYRFAMGRDRRGDMFPLYRIDEQYIWRNASNKVKFTLDSPVVLNAYWSRLSTDFVRHGAGALKLFLDQAEKVKNAYDKKPKVAVSPSFIDRFFGKVNPGQQYEPVKFSPNEIDSILADKTEPTDDDNDVRAQLFPLSSSVTPFPSVMTSSTTVLSSFSPPPSPSVTPTLPGRTETTFYSSGYSASGGNTTTSTTTTSTTTTATTTSTTTTTTIFPTTTSTSTSSTTTTSTSTTSTSATTTTVSPRAYYRTPSGPSGPNLLTVHADSSGPGFAKPFEKCEKVAIRIITTTTGRVSSYVDSSLGQITKDFNLADDDQIQAIILEGGNGSGGVCFEGGQVFLEGKSGPAVPVIYTVEGQHETKRIVINEVAWMGTGSTSALANDEWIELFNPTSAAVSVAGWHLKTSGSLDITLASASIGSGGFFLLERTNDSTVSDISANQIYTGNLKDDCEPMELHDKQGVLIDSISCAGGWYAGTKDGRYTMERVDPSESGNKQANWATNNGQKINGLNADGQPIHGTPRSQNSVFGSSPTPTPTPSPNPTPTPTPTSGQIVWKFQAPNASFVNQPKVAPNGKILFGAPDGTAQKSLLYSLNTNGTKAWSFENNIGVPTGVAVTNEGKIIFGTADQDSYVHALNPSGTMKWEYAYPGRVDDVTVDDDGSAYFLANNNGTVNVTKLSPNGAMSWRVPNNPNFSMGYKPMLAGTDGDVYIESYDGLPSFYRLSGANGTVVWHKRDSGGNSYSAFDMVYDAQGDKFYVTGRNYGQIMEFGRGESQGISRFVFERLGVPTTKAGINGDLILVGIDFTSHNPASGSAVYALNKADKTVRWKYQLNSPVYGQFAFDPASNSYFLTEAGDLYSLDGNGEKRWSTPLGMQPRSYPVSGTDGIFVGRGSELLKIGY